MRRITVIAMAILMVGTLLIAGCTTTETTPPAQPEATTPEQPEITEDTTPPSEVSGLTATAGNRAVILEWEEPADADFAKVEILYNELGSPIEVAKGNTSTEITGLTAGVEYTFSVSAVDLSDNKSSAVEASATPFFGECTSLEYFPVMEGHGIKYHVTDDYKSLDCNVWAVSQHAESDKSTRLDFVFTLIEEGTGGAYYSNSLGGDIWRDLDEKDVTFFYAGFPSGYQGHCYMSFSLPSVFSSGDEWSTWSGEFSVEYVGAQTVNGVEFEDCIKISQDNSLNDISGYRGSGYFVLARDVGIVQLVFNRTSGQDVLYEYIEHGQMVKHTVSGTISDGGEPVEGIVVQISNANWGIRSVTDANGAFSVEVYGSDIILRIDYDNDNDDVLDFGSGYPKEYPINDIMSDITNLSIDISTLN
jgi:hypothetical protein